MDRRILLLLTDLQIGGTPTVVRELAFRLHDPPRVTVTVACLDRRGPVADQIEQRGIEVMALDVRRRLKFSFPRFVWAIHQKRFDTVISFLVHANFYAALASLMSPGVRFIQSIQTTQPEPRWHWRLQRFVQHAAEKIIVPSPSVAAAAAEWAKIPDKKIVVIPNGVDLPAALPPLAPPTSPHRVVFIGRLDPVKCLPDLIAAMDLLKDFARLDIYGEGKDRPKLTAQIEQLNLQQHVTLHSAIPAPAAALQNAELLVLPSLAEGFGLVLIEAMAAGVPVVATDVPGIREVVRNNETGLLVPVHSPALLAAAIRRVLEDQSLRESLTRAAFADVQNRFTWTTAITQFRALLQI